MRQIFSLRFFMAVGAVVALFFLLTTFFAAREVIDGGDGAGASGPEEHRIDFVERVFSSSNPSFGVDEEGLAIADTDLVIDGTRSLRLVTGTPGEVHCDDLTEIGGCAVVADLLGTGVVWFALVPMGDGATVDLPAIDILEDGRAHLVNGWQLPYAPVLDRRCRDDAGDDVQFDSYRQFRDALGDDFTSVYSLETRRLEAVVCNERVPWAPPPSSDVAVTSPTSSPASTTATTTPTTTGSSPVTAGG